MLISLVLLAITLDTDAARQYSVSAKQAEAIELIQRAVESGARITITAANDGRPQLRVSGSSSSHRLIRDALHLMQAAQEKSNGKELFNAAENMNSDNLKQFMKRSRK